jgi:membrane protein implicated in regulation of membrane protease activity
MLFLIVLFLLILAAVAGILGLIIKVALGVAFGIFLGFALVAGVVWWRVRRAIWGPRPRWREVRGPSGSRIEVLDRDHRI